MTIMDNAATYGYTAEASFLEAYVIDKFGEAGSAQDTTRALNGLVTMGWDAYGIGYGESRTLMHEHGDDIMEIISTYADDIGIDELSIIRERMEPYGMSHSNFCEVTVGIMCELVARDLMESDDWNEE